MLRVSIIALLLFTAACREEPREAPPGPELATSAPPPATENTTPMASSGLPAVDPMKTLAIGLQRVEAKKVCMINERVFENDQIPIEIDTKTYYGCCPMCKAALEEDASKRTAVDPVSKKTVDKAVAVIGADKLGRVYYFENEANMRAFTPPA